MRGCSESSSGINWNWTPSGSAAAAPRPAITDHFKPRLQKQAGVSSQYAFDTTDDGWRSIVQQRYR